MRRGEKAGGGGGGSTRGFFEDAVEFSGGAVFLLGFVVGGVRLDRGLSFFRGHFLAAGHAALFLFLRDLPLAVRSHGWLFGLQGQFAIGGLFGGDFGVFEAVFDRLVGRDVVGLSAVFGAGV